ncbi:MAG TPA: HPF/RaiA family ribosome-associated protein [Verrucomicrobiae bacterium]|nr:HPF/RaiA family ribosome-associated protein [Verrucomicrobiae bacterium]
MHDLDNNPGEIRGDLRAFSLWLAKRTIQKTFMKIQFHIRGFNLDAGSRHWLEQPLEALQRLIPINAAAVVLEHQRDVTPAFRAFVSLAVPGPDIHAEAHDHTLEAVWLKVTATLRRQIEQRKTRQLIRVKSNDHLRVPASLRSQGLAGVRA